MTTDGPVVIHALRARYEAGETIAELADSFGTSRETLRRAMIEAGIPRRPRGSPSGKHRPAGGRVDDRDGYLLIRMPEHPYANRSGYVREHRLVMERQLGRYLDPLEVVVHINGLPDDNRPENLRVYTSNAASNRDGLRGNQRAKGDLGNPRRSHRVVRSPEQILRALVELRKSLDREVRRSDLGPPNPSYRAVAHAFGNWRNGVALALEQSRADAPVSRDVAPTPVHPASRDGPDSLRGVQAA